MSEATKKKRVGPLSGVGQVCAEMARCYREARRGELPIKDASRLVHMLGQLRAGLEAGDLEQRIAALHEGSVGKTRAPAGA